MFMDERYCSLVWIHNGREPEEVRSSDLGRSLGKKIIQSAAPALVEAARGFVSFTQERSKGLGTCSRQGVQIPHDPNLQAPLMFLGRRKE